MVSVDGALFKILIIFGIHAVFQVLIKALIQQNAWLPSKFLEEKKRHVKNLSQTLPSLPI